LPLDAHPVYGNNAQIAKLLDIKFEKLPNDDLVLFGEFKHKINVKKIHKYINKVFDRKALHIFANKPLIKKIAWCSGGAQDYFNKVIEYNNRFPDKQIDAYITGEISEPQTHLARETNIHYFAAGHHATERYGVQALGEHLADKFKIKHEFIDIANPV
jgi:putative NIF3 family GTP cyclohydrolase 1 type 2